MKRVPQPWKMALVMACVAWIALPAVHAVAGNEADNQAEPDAQTDSDLNLVAPFSVEALSLDFVEPDVEAPRISRDVPWLSQDQLYYDGDRSGYWNSFFRGGRGQLVVTAVEYVTYDYNNRTTTNDQGVIREFHHMLHLAGSPYPGVRLFAGAGINTLQIDRGDDGQDKFFNYTGLTFDIGFDIGLSLHERIVLEFGARYRQYQAERGMGSDDYEKAYIQWYRIHSVVSFEFLGERKGVTWGMYVGGGANLSTQSWHFLDGRDKITPNNSGSLQNGPSRYDIIVGTNLAISELLNFNIEGRFIGPIILNLNVSFLV